MGEIVGTIVIKVPYNVVYNAIRELFLSGWIDPHHKKWTTGSVEYMLIEDAPNSELIFKPKQHSTTIEERFTLRSIQNESTEVTYRHKYRLVTDSARLVARQTLGWLLTLQYGYQAKVEKHIDL